MIVQMFSCYFESLFAVRVFLPVNSRGCKFSTKFIVVSNSRGLAPVVLLVELGRKGLPSGSGSCFWEEKMISEKPT